MRDVTQDANPSSTNRSKWSVPAAFVVAMLVSVAIYRPDRSLPFEFVDFSEFLPFLKEDSFPARLDALLGYYKGQQGRANVLIYAALAAKWTAFGDYSPAWQWLRFATMWSIALLAYALLRKLRFNSTAAMLGASLFVFSPPAADGFIRLSQAEPVVSLILFALCFVCLRRANSSNELAVGAAVAFCAACIVLYKEILAATLILPILLLLTTRTKQRLGTPRERLRTIVIALLVAVPVASLPVLAAAANAPSDAYMSAFGTKLRPLTDAIAHWTLTMLPFSPGTSFPPQAVGGALVLMMVGAAVGWRQFLRASRDESTPEQKRLLALGLVFPLVGIVIYLPWPTYLRFYAIPFLFGGAVIVAGAFTGLQSMAPAVGRMAVGVWMVFLSAAATDAWSQANRMAALQRLNFAVVSRLSDVLDRADTAYFATDIIPPTYKQGIGPTLQLYSAAVGFEGPAIVNAPCEASKVEARQAEHPFVFYRSLCSNPASADPIVEKYRRFDNSDLRFEVDSLRADFFVPPSSRKVGDAR